MINKFKPAFLFLTLLLFLQRISGQTSLNMADYLSQRFLKYCETVPREEIYIHNDRDTYISGEDLWFNIYLIDRQTLKPSSGSRIVYLEILNTENRPVIQKRILIDKGFGPGQIALPDTLSSGTYTIRAYTSWMKNFLPYNCFSKEIAIYNPLTNKAFKRRLNHENFIKSDDTNNTYHYNSSSGITLEVNNSRPDSLEVFVKADNKFRLANNNICYIFVQSHGNINLVAPEKINDEITRIIISKSLLNVGINQITFFDSKGIPVAGRLIYTPVSKTNLLTLHSDDKFDLRNKITLELETEKELLSEKHLSNLSISVSPQSVDLNTNDIDDYLVFGTEFGLPVQNLLKGRKISDLRPEIVDSILLNARSNWLDWAAILTTDPPRFRYQMEKEENFLPGKLMRDNKDSIHRDELLLMCTPGKEAEFQYAKTDAQGNFTFGIHIDDMLKDLIIMPDDINENQTIILESPFSDQYLKPAVSVDSSSKQLPPEISKLSVNHQVQKIYGNASIGTQIDPAFQPLKPVRFYGQPDIELVLADYINLPVMNEIFFELLPGVSMKKKKSTFEISITYHAGDDLVVTSPCLMIDGVIIKDASLIANLDPETVYKIDVIKEKYLVGKYLFPGIVNVITRAGDFSCVSIPGYMIRQPYRVTEPVRSFVSPDYSSAEMKESHIPDYRNTLYWNPAVKPDADGRARVEFWSSDNKSNYVINIQGVTQEGKIFSLRKIIKVK